MNLRRTRAVAKKEFLHVVRDYRSLIVALAMPMMMLLLFGYALSLDVDEIPTIVWDMDKTPQSRELVERFRATRFFRITCQTESYSAIEEGINRGLITFGIIVPMDYSRNLLSGREARVQLIFDGSDSNTASIAVGYADILLQAYSAELRKQTIERKAG